MAGLETKTNVVVWDGAKGIDEAVLQNLSLCVGNISDWRVTLEGQPLEEVQEVWAEFSYAPLPK